MYIYVRSMYRVLRMIRYDMYVCGMYSVDT